ncbi:NF041680 family putative transposase [Promicromonospora soli]
MAVQPAAAVVLDSFRQAVYDSFERRADVLCELVDAVACAPGRVTDLARLSLTEEFSRGHGALYDGLNAGRVDPGRLGDLVAGLAVPTICGPEGRDRVVLAVDVSNWLRPDAATSPDRSFCHVYGRGRSAAQIIPGWKYSFVAALEAGASSWTALLDVVRLRPDDDETTVTGDQLRVVVGRLSAAGHWQPGDPDMLVVMDSGYDVVRLAWLLKDLPVVLIARLRSDRVLRAPVPARRPGTMGRPPKHGPRLTMKDPDTWPAAAHVTSNATARYGTATATGWDRMHTVLNRRGAWEQHDQDLPVIEGTLIRLSVERLPGERDPKPVWLWASTTAATTDEIDHYWSTFLRRFDLEHTFRLLKQVLGWTRPMLRGPQAADLWTWVILLAHTQLRLARPLAADQRLPWQRPQPPALLTPARVRADFPRIHRTMNHPAAAPKPSRPGPGRPPGRKNNRKAPIQPVGKTPTG